MDLFAKRGLELDDYADGVLGLLEIQDILSLCTSTGEVWSRFCLVNNAGIELPNKGVREALDAVQHKVDELSAKLPHARVNATKRVCRYPIRATSIPLTEAMDRKVPDAVHSTCSDSHAEETTERSSACTMAATTVKFGTSPLPPQVSSTPRSTVSTSSSQTAKGKVADTTHSMTSVSCAEANERGTNTATIGDMNASSHVNKRKASHVAHSTGSALRVKKRKGKSANAATAGMSTLYGPSLVRQREVLENDADCDTSAREEARPAKRVKVPKMDTLEVRSKKARKMDTSATEVESSSKRFRCMVDLCLDDDEL